MKFLPNNKILDKPKLKAFAEVNLHETHKLKIDLERIEILVEKRGVLKTLQEKEKMLVTCIFSFSHNVFYPSQKEFSVFNVHVFCL